MLRATVAKRFDSLSLEVALEAPRGQMTAVVGEPGAGKTALLRLLAGLDDPDRGHIVVGDRTWYDGAPAATVPAWRRDIGYLPEDHALFPHLSVFENVAFGLRSQGLEGRGLRERVTETLERLDVAGLAESRPRGLSAGQRQRVALARTLVTEPALLLLDEPGKGLDSVTARQARADLRRLLAGLPCVAVYATRSPREAIMFGERIVVLEAGQVTQTGTAYELLAQPRSAYASEIGVNLYRGTIGYRDFAGMAEVQTPERTLSVVDPGGEEPVFVAVGPRDVTLHLEPPTGSAPNVFQGAIGEIVPQPPYGERLRVALDSQPPLVAEVTRNSVETLGLAVGLPVFASFKASAVFTYR